MFASRRLVLAALAAVVLGSVATTPAQGTPPTPPAIIPSFSATMALPANAYLQGRNLYHLPERVFYLWLGDTPKAVLMRAPADFLASDDDFFYLRDTRMQREFAFSRKPEDNFLANHAIFTRRQGEVVWQLSATDATLAAPK